MKRNALFSRISSLFLALLCLPVLQAQYFNLSTDVIDRDEVRNIQVLGPAITPIFGAHSVSTGFSEDLSVASGPISFANLSVYDATGAEIWTHIYDWGTGLSRGNAVEQTPTGGFIVAGHGINPNSGVPNALVFETDPSGAVLWAQFYDFFSPYSEAFSIEVVPDPSLFGYRYVVTGSYSNPFNGTMDAFVMGIDGAGAVIAMTQFDSGVEEEGLSVKIGPGSTSALAPSVYISGKTTFGAPGENVMLAELDPGLTLIWSLSYGGPGDESGNTLEVFPAGDLVVGGYSNSFSNGNLDVFMSMHAPGGGFVWSNIYGQKKNEEAHSVECFSDGTIAVTGWTDKTSTGTRDAFLFKTDLAGTLLWSRNFGSPRDDIGYSVKESFDPITGLAGEVLMGGVFEADLSAAFDDRDIYHVRTDAFGDGACGKNPKFRQLPVAPLASPIPWIPGSLYYSDPVLPADPIVPVVQNDECCDCSDMMVSFISSPASFCASDVVTFTNTSNCVDQFRWSVNGVVVSFSTDLSYVFGAPGTYTVTLDGRNAGCPIVSYSQTFTITCLREEGSAEAELFPNPASSVVRVRAEIGETDREGQLLLRDATGRTVMERTVQTTGAKLDEILNVSEMPEGFYTVEFRQGEQQWIQRLVVQH